MRFKPLGTDCVPGGQTHVLVLGTGTARACVHDVQLPAGPSTVQPTPITVVCGCRVHRRVKHIISHCRDDYNWFDDDTKDYTPKWEKVLNKTAARMSDETNNGTKRCKTPWCYQVSSILKSNKKL